MTKHNGMAIAIAWPEFIGKQPGSWYDTPMRWLGHNKKFQYKVGHASLILVDVASGNCSYFDCGRYHAPYQHGRIRDVATDANLEIHTKALISDHKINNIDALLNEVQSNKSSFGMGPLYASYCPVNFHLAYTTIKKMQSKGAIPFGPFVINGINCCRFVRAGILAGNPAFKYQFRLRYLWPFKPMPITNVAFLSDKIIIPEIQTNGNPEQSSIQQQHHSHFLYTKENVKGTLPEPHKPETIPPESQWLSGEVAGGWFWLQPNKNDYTIVRYSQEGIPESTGNFKLLGNRNFDAHQPYFFTYLSHCSKVTLIQNQKRFELIRED